jgi:LCP family protein required for cell wall assembly
MRRGERRDDRGEPRDPESPSRRRLRRPTLRGKRWWKWVLAAVGAWLLISFLAFGISSQLQSFKLSGDAKSVLGGDPLMIASPQTILLIGTDARPPNTKEPGAAPSQRCYDQQAHGDAPHAGCSQGQFRADTLLLVRAGGGSFRKLSIPRDSAADIPGFPAQKINAAYAFGGAKLEIQTVENFLNINIDHAAIIDFQGFQSFIDAIGGVKVNVPGKLCADISGGSGGGQGGITLRLNKGEHVLSGERALAYSRVREPSPCPGTAPSAFSKGYNDVNRAQAQQAVIAGIKDRLTDPLRLPYNFLKGPIIGWDAPQAFVSDMGFFTMPQLVASAAIGGNAKTQVLCTPVATSGCQPGVGPLGSTVVPTSTRQQAVNRFLHG